MAEIQRILNIRELRKSICIFSILVHKTLKSLYCVKRLPQDISSFEKLSTNNHGTKLWLFWILPLTCKKQKENKSSPFKDLVWQLQRSPTPHLRRPPTRRSVFINPYIYKRNKCQIHPLYEKKCHWNIWLLTFHSHETWHRSIYMSIHSTSARTAPLRQHTNH